MPVAISGGTENWKQDANSIGKSREENRDYIKGLIREREACERRGLPERVALIDAELERVGHKAVAPAKRSERRPASPPRESR